jgi:hypothetical protein
VIAAIDATHSVLRDAGLSAVVVKEVQNPFHGSSFDDWWSRVPALAGPLAQMLAALPPDALQAIRDQAESALRRYSRPAGLEIPGLTLVAAARRA